MLFSDAMSKFRMMPFGHDDKGRAIGRVTGGKDATGTLIGCKPGVAGKPTPLGYQSAIFSSRAEDCQVDVEIVDGKEETTKIDFEDRSDGPAKVNSAAFRDGWEQTFRN